MVPVRFRVSLSPPFFVVVVIILFFLIWYNWQTKGQTKQHTHRIKFDEIRNKKIRIHKACMSSVNENKRADAASCNTLAVVDDLLLSTLLTGDEFKIWLCRQRSNR